MSGYARLHRSLIGHPAFRNDAEAMAFAWMVLRASWKECRVRYKGRAFTLQRGQLAISQRDMADALDRDKAWVERLWKRLKAEAMIEAVYEAGAAVITLCNYERYQASNDDREAVGEADARQTRGTEQEDKQSEEENDLEPNGSCASGDALQPEHVVEIWNELAERTGKPKVKALTPERRQRLKARIAGYSLDDWRSVLGAVERSAFLRGDTGWHGCSFDWITKKSNFQKTLEGNYNDKPAASTARH